MSCIKFNVGNNLSTTNAPKLAMLASTRAAPDLTGRNAFLAFRFRWTDPNSAADIFSIPSSVGSGTDCYTTFALQYDHANGRMRVIQHSGGGSSFDLAALDTTAGAVKIFDGKTDEDAIVLVRLVANGASNTDYEIYAQCGDEFNTYTATIGTPNASCASGEWGFGKLTVFDSTYTKDRFSFNLSCPLTILPSAIRTYASAGAVPTMAAIKAIMTGQLSNVISHSAWGSPTAIHATGMHFAHGGNIVDFYGQGPGQRIYGTNTATPCASWYINTNPSSPTTGDEISRERNLNVTGAHEFVDPYREWPLEYTKATLADTVTGKGTVRGRAPKLAAFLRGSSGLTTMELHGQSFVAKGDAAPAFQYSPTLFLSASYYEGLAAALIQQNRFAGFKFIAPSGSETTIAQRDGDSLTSRTNYLAAAQNITGITKANPGVLTYSGSDTYANGDRVLLQNIGGMTELNNKYVRVANVNTGANTFELEGINTTNFTTYTSGGTVREHTIAANYTLNCVAGASDPQSNKVDYHNGGGNNVRWGNLGRDSYSLSAGNRGTIGGGNVICFDNDGSDAATLLPADASQWGATASQGRTMGLFYVKHSLMANSNNITIAGVTRATSTDGAAGTDTSTVTSTTVSAYVDPDGYGPARTLLTDAADITGGHSIEFNGDIDDVLESDWTMWRNNYEDVTKPIVGLMIKGTTEGSDGAQRAFLVEVTTISFNGTKWTVTIKPGFADKPLAGATAQFVRIELGYTELTGIQDGSSNITALRVTQTGSAGGEGLIIVGYSCYVPAMNGAVLGAIGCGGLAYDDIPLTSPLGWKNRISAAMDPDVSIMTQTFVDNGQTGFDDYTDSIRATTPNSDVAYWYGHRQFNSATGSVADSDDDATRTNMIASAEAKNVPMVDQRSLGPAVDRAIGFGMNEGTHPSGYGCIVMAEEFLDSMESAAINGTQQSRLGLGLGI